ncbi:HAMP domain-containing histidine kinase [Halobaculum sp. CBA1158]|uniref:sensor histidine kinase n=1 Tax=Halobaculum sp. CBA1158 TaxID=2904243 RepID=UPI001F2C601A|nr:HAMP domain-containing sensor histidine kinase [Halobaculum sp. CBA1158]UIP00401.1 HAMP domain-containing histidine kinase [Halobaculum sp. CBA1158]
MTDPEGAAGSTAADGAGGPESGEEATDAVDSGVAGDRSWFSPALAASGLFTAALALGTAGVVFASPSRTPGSVVLGLTGPLCAIWAYGVVLLWVARAEPPRRHHVRLSGWLVVGVVPLVVGAVVTQAYSSAVGALDGISPGAAGVWACGGVVFGAAVGIGDVRVRMRTAEAERANARNERLVEVLTVLNRVLRHDVRNDLTVIAGYIDLARREGDPEIAEYLDGIEARAERIERLSDHARLAENAVLGDDGVEGTTDLGLVAERVVGTVGRDFPAATVSVAVEDGPSPRVPGHDLLESALHNVVENAVEHAGRDDPTVEVAVRVRPADDLAADRRPTLGDDGGRVAADEVVEIEVADDGPGFPERERTVLEEGGEDALESSSGMGLWVVHWIVDAVGGTASVADREGGGSVVTLRFPRADAE